MVARGWLDLHLIVLGSEAFFEWVKSLPLSFWGSDSEGDWYWQTVFFHRFEPRTRMDAIATQLKFSESRREAKQQGYDYPIPAGLSEEKRKGKTYHKMRRWITWSQRTEFV